MPRMEAPGPIAASAMLDNWEGNLHVERHVMDVSIYLTGQDDFRSRCTAQVSERPKEPDLRKEVGSSDIYL